MRPLLRILQRCLPLSPHRRTLTIQGNKLFMNIDDPFPALSSTATRRNAILRESIAALVWDLLQETDPESVEKRVSRQVGTMPRQALPPAAGNSFIRAVFTRLTSLISLPRSQQPLSSSFYAIRVTTIPLPPLAQKRHRITIRQIWYTHCSEELRRGGLSLMTKLLSSCCASSMVFRVNQLPTCVPVWAVFARPALANLERPQSQRKLRNSGRVQAQKAKRRVEGARCTFGTVPR